MSLLESVIIEPATTANSAVIWLHGLGADGNDFAPIVPQLQLPADHGVRFVFPHAPAIPVTINGGMVMPAWFDITGLTSERQINRQQLLDASNALHRLIDREIANGIASQRIVIAGFSQGGTVAYQAALTYSKTLAGLLALSSYFANATDIVPQQANAKLPIAIFHGHHDAIVTENLGHNAQRTLQAMGYQPDYHTYPIEHNVCLEEIADITRYLCRWLKLTI
jgi:phospholipase/carboxylesterase